MPELPRYVISKDEQAISYIGRHFQDLKIDHRKLDKTILGTSGDACVVLNILTDYYGQQACRINEVISELNDKGIEIGYGLDGLQQIGVQEFHLRSGRPATFAKEFGEYLMSLSKRRMEVCDVTPIGNPGDAVVLLRVDSNQDIQNILQNTHVYNGRAHSISEVTDATIHTKKKAQGQHALQSRKDDFDSPDINEKFRSPKMVNPRPGQGKQVDPIERIEFESIKMVKLVWKMLELGDIYVNKDKIRIQLEGTCLYVSGNKPDITQFKNDIEDYIQKEPYAKEVYIGGDVARHFVETSSGKKYLEEFFVHNDKHRRSAVEFLVSTKNDGSLEIVSFLRDTASEVSALFEQRLLHAQIATSRIANKGRFKNGLKDLKKKHAICLAYIDFKEKENRVEIHGAAQDVIKLVGDVERLVFDCES